MKKVALVTGAGGGLGAHLALHLGNLGYTVGIHYRNNRVGAELVRQKLSNLKCHAKTFQADLSTETGASQLIEQVDNNFHRLDVLINNAGTYHNKLTMELSETEWFEGLNSTVSTTFFTTRASLPFLRKAENARIINIGDSSCDRPTARDLSLSYHIGKTGVLMLTKTFARQEAEHGTTVNMISPGYLENSEARPNSKTIPAGRFGKFEDIENAVSFFLKEKNNYVTGSNLILSGGWNLR